MGPYLLPILASDLTIFKGESVGGNPLVKHFIPASLLLVLIGNCCLIALAPTVQGELVQNSVIVTMISKISEIEIYNTVNRLQNFTTRTYGSSGNV